MDTKTKRAAALGYSLAFLLVAPVADAVISMPDAGHALSAYSWDLPPSTTVVVWDRAEYLTNPTLANEECL